jgi:hypothetical protein
MDLRKRFHVLKGDVSISTLDIPKKSKIKRELKGKGVRNGVRAYGRNEYGTRPQGMRLVERKDPRSNQMGSYQKIMCDLSNYVRGSVR